MHDYLTTRELADLLRIKERKVYDLVAENRIPVSRVTGKLLFPRDVIEAWVRRNTEFGAGQAALADHDPIVAGSHDPLLEWALRQSGSELASYFDGSSDGLSRLKRGEAVAAGIHFTDEAGHPRNKAVIQETLPGEPVVAVEWAHRRQGLVVQRGNPLGIADIGGLAGRSVIRRQPGAGSFALLMQHVSAVPGLAGEIRFLDDPARSHSDVAQAIAMGKADAGLAVEAVARQMRLDFVPLASERYDLVVWRRDYFEAPLQRLLRFTRTETFASQARELGGYDISSAGTVHYNGS